MKDRFLAQFLSLIAVETRASEEAKSTPSSDGQFVLGRQLADTLKNLGLSEVKQDEHGYVTGILSGNTEKRVPRFALIAHIDTAPDLPGKNDHPGILSYNGGDITLADGFVIRSKDFPFMNKLKGHTIITTDGTTLLGADNKAGIAIILETICRLKESELPRGDLAVVFTPDEEIGHGAALLDLEALGASFGYTIDGGGAGEYETETFNAASATLEVTGRIVHPGSAKNVMINAVNLASEFLSLLPAAERPETTEGYEGFFYVNHLEADTEKAVIRLIIRDHDKASFLARKALLESAVAFLRQKHGDRFTLVMSDQYYNMDEKIIEMPVVETLLEDAIKAAGLSPIKTPVRGGTDGSRLSWRGLPCPNFFTGGYNFHSKSEILSVDEALQSVDVAVALVHGVAEYDWSARTDKR